MIKEITDFDIKKILSNLVLMFCGLPHIIDPIYFEFLTKKRLGIIPGRFFFYI
jgi:hypothetical protein